MQTSQKNTKDITSNNLADGNISIGREDEFPEIEEIIPSVATQDVDHVNSGGSDFENETNSESNKTDNRKEEEDLRDSFLMRLLKQKKSVKRNVTRKKTKSNEFGLPLVFTRKSFLKMMKKPNQEDQRESEKFEMVNLIKAQKKKIEHAARELNDVLYKEAKTDTDLAEKENQFLQNFDDWRESQRIQPENLIMRLKEQGLREREQEKHQQLQSNCCHMICNENHSDSEFESDEDSDGSFFESDSFFARSMRKCRKLEHHDHDLRKISQAFSKLAELYEELNECQKLSRLASLKDNLNRLEEARVSSRYNSKSSKEQQRRGVRREKNEDEGEDEDIASDFPEKGIYSQMLLLNRMATMYVHQCNEVLSNTISMYRSDMTLENHRNLLKNQMGMRPIPQLNFQFLHVID